MLLKIAEKHHDLSNEIHLLIQPHYLEPLSSAAKEAVPKLIKSLGSN